MAWAPSLPLWLVSSAHACCLMHVPAESDYTMCRPGQGQLWTCPLRARQECSKLGLGTGQPVSQTSDWSTACYRDSPANHPQLSDSSRMDLSFRLECSRIRSCNKAPSSPLRLSSDVWESFYILTVAKTSLNLDQKSKTCTLKAMVSKFFPLSWNLFFWFIFSAVIALLLLACLLQRVFVAVL